MALDVKALVETMRVVEIADDRDLWNQMAWLTGPPEDAISPVHWKGQSFCGTAGCFAGWRVMLDGWQPYRVSGVVDGVVLDGVKVGVDVVPDLAQDRLGLTDDQRFYLFHENNDLDDLRDLVDVIVIKAVNDPEQGVR